MTQRAKVSRSLLLGSLAAPGAVCLTSSPSEACKKRHQTPFELYDLAAAVAQVRVQAVPAPAHTENRPGPGDEVAAAALATSCRDGTALAR